VAPLERGEKITLSSTTLGQFAPLKKKQKPIIIIILTNDHGGGC
jgi:hypothetical protein